MTSLWPLPIRTQKDMPSSALIGNRVSLLLLSPVSGNFLPQTSASQCSFLSVPKQAKPPDPRRPPRKLADTQRGRVGLHVHSPGPFQGEFNPPQDAHVF